VEIPVLEYVTTLKLSRNGDCNLLGVGSDLTVYTEEVYSEDAWVAQSAVRLDGTVVEAVDEDYGQNASVRPLALPDHIKEPKSCWHTMGLNFTGARHRGLRVLEHIAEVTRPISPDDKLMLSEQLRVSPPMILGLAESYVLAEAELVHPHLFLVCRRLRLAYGLEEEKLDDHNQPYDYDTQVVYAAHLYDRTQDTKPSLREALAGLPGVRLHRPMDCMIAHEHVFVADGGEGDRASAVHVWRIERDARSEV